MTQAQAQARQATPSGTVEDVARLMNVSVRQVYRLAESGDLPSYRIGRLLRFDLAEVVAATRTPRPA